MHAEYASIITCKNKALPEYDHIVKYIRPIQSSFLDRCRTRILQKNRGNAQIFKIIKLKFKATTVIVQQEQRILYFFAGIIFVRPFRDTQNKLFIVCASHRQRRAPALPELCYYEVGRYTYSMSLAMIRPFGQQNINVRLGTYFIGSLVIWRWY